MIGSKLFVKPLFINIIKEWERLIFLLTVYTFPLGEKKKKKKGKCLFDTLKERTTAPPTAQ